MSRRQFQPSEQQRREVATMSGFGVAQHEIARMLDIDPKTLRRAFRRELDVGTIQANVRVAAALYANATKHNSTAAQIFWCKARMGWKEAQDLNIGGTNMPLNVSFRWADATPPADGTSPTIIDAEAETEAGDTTAGTEIAVR